jgi:hypothetical protein
MSLVLPTHDFLLHALKSRGSNSAEYAEFFNLTDLRELHLDHNRFAVLSVPPCAHMPHCIILVH